MPHNLSFKIQYLLKTAKVVNILYEYIMLPYFKMLQQLFTPNHLSIMSPQTKGDQNYFKLKNKENIYFVVLFTKLIELIFYQPSSQKQKDDFSAKKKSFVKKP